MTSRSLPELPDNEIAKIEDSVASNVNDVVAERVRQERLRLSGKFENSCASPGVSDGTILRILAEEVDETLDEADDLRRALGRLTRFVNDHYGNSSSNEITEIKDRLRTELIQVLAVGFGWLQNIDGRSLTSNVAENDVPDYVQTRTGLSIRVMEPQPESIAIEDIAWGLASEARYNNVLNTPYTVAQHCVLAAKQAKVEGGGHLAAWILLHDAAEAYLKDIPSPIKRTPKMVFYRMAETRLERVIFRKFGLMGPVPEEVKNIDRKMLVTEIRDLVPQYEKAWNIPGIPYDFKIKDIWDREKAEREYLEIFAELESEGYLHRGHTI